MAQHLISFAQTTDQEPDDLEDDKRQHRRPADDPDRGQELFPQLMERVAEEPAAPR